MDWMWGVKNREEMQKDSKSYRLEPNKLEFESRQCHELALIPLSSNLPSLSFSLLIYKLRQYSLSDIINGLS